MYTALANNSTLFLNFFVVELTGRAFTRGVRARAITATVAEGSRKWTPAIGHVQWAGPCYSPHVWVVHGGLQNGRDGLEGRQNPLSGVRSSEDWKE